MADILKKFHIRVDPKAEIPIYVQLKNQLRYLLQSRELVPGEQLPTVRELAVELSITANTVARVYAELESEGLILRVQGKGTFVAEFPKPRTETDTISQAREILSGSLKSLRGLGLTDFEIKNLLMEVSSNLNQF